MVPVEGGRELAAQGVQRGTVAAGEAQVEETLVEEAPGVLEVRRVVVKRPGDLREEAGVVRSPPCRSRVKWLRGF